MKKLFLVGALALFGAMNAQSGNFKLGAHLGLPTGDAADASSLNIGVDAAYLFPVADGFKLGLTTGYSAYLGKTVMGYKVPTLSVIPVAATGQYNVSENVYIGADLGYGFWSSDGLNGGGFYYQPKVGYVMGNTELYLGYKGLSDDGSTLSSVNLGVAFNLSK